MNFANFPWVSYLITVFFALAYIAGTAIYSLYTGWKNRENEYKELSEAAGQEIDAVLLRKEKSDYYQTFFRFSFKIYPILFLLMLILFFLIFAMPPNNDNPFSIMIKSPALWAVCLSLFTLAIIPFCILFHYVSKWEKKRFLSDMEKLQEMIRQ